MTGKVQITRVRGRAPGTALGIMIVLFLLVGCATAAPPAGIESYHGREAAANQVLVKFHAATPEQIHNVKVLEDVDYAEAVGSTGAMVFHSRSKNVATLISDLSERAGVEYAEPDYIVYAVNTPNDPSFGSLWGMNKISAPSAWDSSTGSSANLAAVIDTGIDYTHPDLAANVWSAPAEYTVTIAGNSITCPAGSHGFNAITNTCNPMDDHGHGTHVAGTIGAVGNNGAGVAGVNWDTKVIGAKFLNKQGSGTTSNAVNAIDFVIQTKSRFGNDANVRVLSNSWGGGGSDQTLLDEINKANSNNMLFVAAAGNTQTGGLNNDILPFYPASYTAPNVVAVAATDSSDLLASWSNYGLTSVDLAAPGVSILSTYPGARYAYMSGTSMATPHVSGAALLILSTCNLNTAGLKTNILASVDPVSSLSTKTVTGGRLNVHKAILACSAPKTPTTTTISSVSPPGPSPYGLPVTFTATVTPTSGPGTPTGTVTFSDGGSALGSGTLSSGTASFATSALSAGVHSITASYGSDSAYSGSTSPVVPYTVNKAGSTTGLASSLNPSDFGQTVTFTAMVGPSAATGTVTFSDGGSPLGTSSLNAAGNASYSTSGLSIATHPITAKYNGDSNYATSTSGPLSQKVNPATSVTSLTSSLNPSAFGQVVTFTATVSPAAATGTVTFHDGGSSLGTGTLSGGKVSFSTSGLSIGDHPITATYGGDSNVAGSTSPAFTQTVNSASAGDFSLSVSPASRSVTRGSSNSYTVTITRLSGFAGSVAPSVSGLPSGTSGIFTPDPITGPSSLLLIQTASATPTGKYTLTITGTSGSLIHTSQVTLRVR